MSTNYASPDDIRKAYEALSAEDKMRIYAYAKKRTRGLERIGGTQYEADAAIGEAMSRALDGRKKWPKDSIDFPTFFVQAITNITGHWWTSLCSEKGKLQAAVNKVSGEREHQLLSAVSYDSDPLQASLDEEQISKAEALLMEVRKLVSDSSEALDALEGMEAGLTPKEIRDATGMSQLRWDAARKKIERAVKSVGKARGDHE